MSRPGGIDAVAFFSDPAYHAARSGLPLAAWAAEVMERKLAAILAADIADYGRLMGVDEDGTLNALRAHREVAVGLVATHRGLVFGGVGDGMLAEFPGAVEAINCAVEIQLEMDERNESVPPDRRLQFRVGLNIGDAAAEGGDLQGDDVAIALRVRDLAEPGGICVARNVYIQARHNASVTFESLGHHQIGDVGDPVSIYRVLIGGTRRRPRILRWLQRVRR
jgi:class 3 adenylate cyclase